MYATSCGADNSSFISLPIRNITLASEVVKRGIALLVGSPPQNLAFLIDAYDNNVFVYNVGDMCASNTPPVQCEGDHGGEFDLGSSSTWLQAGNHSSWNGAQADFASDTGDIFGNDILELDNATPTSLINFPIVIEQSTDLTANVIGGNVSSTLLGTLAAGKIIASRSWSVFWGLTGADSSSQMDGNLVLGGYDLAKTTGNNHTAAMSEGQGCTMFVYMTSIQMNFPNGTNFEILGTSQGDALRMCIQPSYPIITIPSNIYDAFTSYSGGIYLNRSYGINLWGQVFEAEDVYPGDLTFTLDSGLPIKIANSQLVVPDVLIDATGSPVFDNDTREILLNSLDPPNNNDIPLLGRTFLTSAYLYVNLDKKQFTLWQANATTDETVVVVGPSVTCSATNTLTAASTSSASAFASTSMSSDPAIQKPSNGTIAGATVGAIIGVALLLAAVSTLQCRSRRKISAAGPAGVEHGMVMYPQGETRDDVNPEVAMHELHEGNLNHEIGEGAVHELGDSGGDGNRF